MAIGLILLFTFIQSVLIKDFLLVDSFRPTIDSLHGNIKEKLKPTTKPTADCLKMRHELIKRNTTNENFKAAYANIACKKLKEIYDMNQELKTIVHKCTSLEGQYYGTLIDLYDGIILQLCKYGFIRGLYGPYFLTDHNYISSNQTNETVTVKYWDEESFSFLIDKSGRTGCGQQFFNFLNSTFEDLLIEGQVSPRNGDVLCKDIPQTFKNMMDSINCEYKTIDDLYSYMQESPDCYKQWTDVDQFDYYGLYEHDEPKANSIPETLICNVLLVISLVVCFAI